MDDDRDRRLAADGDLETLLAIQYARMTEFVRLHRLSEDERQEVLQEAITRHIREVRAGKDYGATPWRVVAYTLVRYAVADHLQRAGRRREHEYVPEEWREIPVEDAVPALERWDLRRRFAGLAEGERRAAWLRYVEGLTPEEIAGMLGMTRNAVDQALFRARRRIRASWDG